MVRVAPIPTWLTVWVFVFIVVARHQAGAVDSSNAGTLEDYLKGLGYETVEFEHTEHVQDFVEGRLSNGRRPRFLVDTGWGMSALNRSIAQGLKQITQEDVKRYGLHLRLGTNTEMVLMDELMLGPIKLMAQPARVEHLNADYIRVPFDGVLGCDFFFRNSCLIDCYKHRLYIRSAKPSTEELKALAGTLQLSGFSEGPLDRDYMLTTLVQINGKPVHIGVDTGAPYDELDDSLVTPLGLKMLRYNQPSTGSLIPKDLSANVIGMGNVGKHQVHFARLATFQLGPRQWKNFDVGVSDLKDWDLAKPGTRGEAVKGLLSQPTLERQGTLIDVAGRKLWFRPEKPAQH